MIIGCEAKRIVRLILRRVDDPRLRWSTDGRVRVHIGKIMRDETGDMQTLADLRKRFRRAVRDRLRRAGWEPAGLNVYAPPSKSEYVPQAGNTNVAAIRVDGWSSGSDAATEVGPAMGMADPVDERIQSGLGGIEVPPQSGSY